MRQKLVGLRGTWQRVRGDVRELRRCRERSRHGRAQIPINCGGALLADRDFLLEQEATGVYRVILTGP